MDKKRFLRDSVLDDMLDEIRSISDKVSESGFPSMMFHSSLMSLSELYESNKHVLTQLEKAIDLIRRDGKPSAVLNEIVDAAVHVQIGLTTVHNALKQDINQVLENIQQLKASLSLEDDDDDETSS